MDPVTLARRIYAITGAGLAAAALLWAAFPARAHDAPTGWTYPAACCSGTDCREVPADWVEERPEGYRIVVTGEVIPMTDRKVRPSPDGRFHWCSVAGKDDGATICLFAPPRSF